MPSLEDLPRPLQVLISDLFDLVTDETGRLGQDLGAVEAWQREMERTLTRYHLAAYMAGQGSEAIDTAGLKAVGQMVEAQLGFLDNFALVVQEAEAFERGWLARAQMYAEAIKVPYWKGRTKVLPLPAMPAEGTQCRTRCKCAWNVEAVDEAAGDYDAYWIRHASDSCQTCIQRAAEWNPLRIRGGELVL